MIPKFDTEMDPPELLCPSCGFNYLHHFRVDVFERNEDANQGLHVTVDNLTLKTTTDLTGNPSSRRDGVVVDFWCEGCHEISRLSIAQHKGVTEFKFLPIGEKMTWDSATHVRTSPPPL